MRGRGRQLVLALGFPPRRGATSWVDARAFPFFWAELLALAADASGQVRSREAGFADEEGAALDVGVFPPGEPRVGTVAAALPADPGGRPQPFDPAALDALEAARPRAETPCGWALFLLAACLGVGSMRPPRDPSRGGLAAGSAR